MDTIKVDKQQLLDTLRVNRDEHRSLFLKAQEKYREAMIVELDRALQEARDGQPIKRMFSLPVPEDHTADFDRAIQMLEWEKGDTVKLEEHDFMQFVQNQWAWRASFAANTQSYLAG